jgi:hypothetical protein
MMMRLDLDGFAMMDQECRSPTPVEVDSVMSATCHVADSRGGISTMCFSGYNVNFFGADVLLNAGKPPLALVGLPWLSFRDRSASPSFQFGAVGLLSAGIAAVFSVGALGHELTAALNAGDHSCTTRRRNRAGPP